MLKQQVGEMEKKPFVRTMAVNAKSSVNDVKPKQDFGNNGKVNRSNWKREVQPKQHSRPELTRKPSPQKSKTFDNRPKPRGNFPHDHDWTEVARCESVEVGSALKPGSRKVNLNHLLNFKYLPRETGSWVGSRYQEGHHGGRGPVWTPRKHKYNKEQFLQANCQFVVQESGDYQVHACDPDLLVDWKFIEQVRLLSHEVPSCPICLYPPVAAKITRCGHIYCWPCILHYLALSDKTWRKCPICFEAVHKIDLKSVVALPAPRYSAGDEISMQLMRRERGSVLAMPKSSWRQTKGRPLDIFDGDMRFSKLLLASKEEVLRKIISREKSELATALESDPHCPEACFIETALQNLGERNEHLGLLEDVVVKADGKIDGKDPDNKNNVNKDSDAEKFNSPIEENKMSTLPPDVCVGTRRRDESLSADSLDGFAFEEDLPVSDSKSQLPNKSGCNSAKDTYYFYQSSDGQHVYLHSLNVRILVQQYGCLELCPDLITAKIVAKEGTSMSEIARNRLRYLSHLPLTAEFEVVELVFQPPLVSKAVLDSFAAEIEGRQRKRNRRERDENRRERYMQMEANKKMGKFPVARLHLDSFAQFPTCQSADETLSVNVPTSEESPRSSPASPVFPEAKPEKAKERNGATPSFAQMLRDGKGNVPKAVMRSPQRSSPTAKEKKEADNSDSDSEGYVHPPEFHLSFGQAIQAAMDKAALASTEDTGVNKKKKKKGRQKLLLFSNAVVRGN